MFYLSYEEITEYVKNYIDENTYNHAIMINGSWGSGKTYFIKEILIPDLLKKCECKRKDIYISLYGLKSSEEIANHIVTATIERRVGKGKKLLPVFNLGFNIVTDFIGDKAGSQTIADLDKNILSPFINYDEYYFIFDDLERCSIPINEVLGYINFFVEQNDAKVILVANEDELGFALDRNNEDHSGSKSNKEMLSQKQIYRKSKEKIVAQTIYYKPDLKEAVSALLGKYIEIKNIETDLFIESICRIMEDNNYYNLRTLQYCLSFFSKICSDYFSMKSDETDYSKMLVILESILKVSLHLEKGDPRDEWERSEHYQAISLTRQGLYQEYFLSFRFVHDYIYYGRYNKDRVNEVLNLYFRDINFELKINPMRTLSRYWELEDEEIIGELELLYHELESDVYNEEAYMFVLALVYKLKDLNLEPIAVNRYFDIIKRKVQEGANLDTIGTVPIEKGDVSYETYERCMKELETIKTLRDEEKLRSINNTFKINDKWGLKFEEFCINNDDLMRGNGFFKHVDIETCVEKLRGGTAGDVLHFRKALNYIYISEYRMDYQETHDEESTYNPDYIGPYIDDYENLLEFKTKLEIQFNGAMKQYHISILKGDLGKLLSVLEDMNTE